jgi:hypothetical protein
MGKARLSRRTALSQEMTYGGNGRRGVSIDEKKPEDKKKKELVPVISGSSGLVRVNYPGRPATTILAGGGGGMFG